MLLTVVISVICMLQYTSVWAETANVIDESARLSSAEVNELQDKTEEIRQRYDMEPVVVIVSDLGGKSPKAYADDYFDNNGYGSSTDGEGILILYKTGVPGDRELWISTSGSETIPLYQPVIEDMLDRIIPYLEKGKDFKAFESFLGMVSNMEQKGTLSTYGSRLAGMVKMPIPYLAALAVAAIATVVITMASKGKVTVNNRTYESINSFQLTNRVGPF